MQPQRVSEADTQANPSDAQEAQTFSLKHKSRLKKQTAPKQSDRRRAPLGHNESSLAPANGEEADGARSSIPQNQKQAGTVKSPICRALIQQEAEAPLHTLASNTPKAAKIPTEQSQDQLSLLNQTSWFGNKPCRSRKSGWL